MGTERRSLGPLLVVILSIWAEVRVNSSPSFERTDL